MPFFLTKEKILAPETDNAFKNFIALTLLMPDYRVEKDFLGEKKIPKNAFYGISTVRSREIFQVSDRKIPLELIRAMAQIKIAAAEANHSLGLLDSKKKSAIVRASKEVVGGKFDDEFILDVFQVGSGTPSHMNVNEVIANRANQIIFGNREKKLVNAHDHVNMGQSTNNVVPSAMRIACMQLLPQADASLGELFLELKKKSVEFKSVIKSGRTHLQDAVPITLGQEFGAFARTIEKHRLRLKFLKQFLKEIGVGGTAVGTGLNTFPEFRKKVVANLNRQTGLKFSVARNGVEATQFLTDLAEVSCTLRLLAVDLNKIAFDLRLMNSGPKTGFAEIKLPAVEPGSSIMPGKVNPSVPECVNMCALQVIGNDVAISIACANGVLELNTHMPLIAANVVESLKLIKNSSRIFAKYAVKGLKADEKMCRYYVEHSAALGTALNPLIGYERSGELIKESLEKGVSVRDLAVQKGLVSESQAKKFLNPANLTKPNMHLFKKNKKTKKQKNEKGVVIKNGF